MTSTGSKEFYDLVPPDVARHIIEGGRIMGPVVEVSLGYRGCKTGFVVKGPAKEWQATGEKIHCILDSELERLPATTKTGLTDIIKFISLFVPDEPLAVLRWEDLLALLRHDYWILTRASGSRYSGVSPHGTRRARNRVSPLNAPLVPGGI